MKYSQVVGVVASLLLIGLCFFPWITIPSKGLTVTGLQSEGTSFGKPGYMAIFFSIINIILFIVPKIWAKRTNIFLATLNFAWCIRNYILLSTCFMAECPVKFWTLYALPFVGLSIFLMALFVPNFLKRNQLN